MAKDEKQKTFNLEYYTADIMEVNGDKLVPVEAFDVGQWLIDHKAETRKYIALSDCNAMITEIKEMENGRYICVRFYKAREGSIPDRIKEGKGPKPIQLKSDEKIAEMLCMLYDCQNKVLALQKTRFSLSRKHLKELFSKKLQENQTVGITQIIDTSPAEMIKSLPLKEIYIRVSNPTYVHKSTALGKMLGNVAEYGSESFSIKLNAGRSRKSRLDPSACGELIDEVTTTRSNQTIANATVKVYDDDKGRNDVYDLLQNKFRDKVAYTVDEKGSTSFDEILNNMLEVYKRRCPDLEKALSPGG